jgi:predicted transcriptional regulator
MRLRAVKRIPIAEVRKRLENYEAKYLKRFQAFHTEFISGTMDRERFQDYVEWSSIIHALRAYNEGEDFEYYAEEDLGVSKREFEMLTPKRLELLDEIADRHVESINELAESLGRDVKNVHSDIKILERLGFIRLTREGRSLVPELLVQEVTIQLG